MTNESASSTSNERPIVLVVRASNLDTLLERALASCRMPVIELLSAAGLVATVSIGSVQSRNDPLVVGVAAMACGLTVGIYLGRWLRPRPSRVEMETFAAEVSERGACTNRIADSIVLGERIEEVCQKMDARMSLEPTGEKAVAAIVDLGAYVRLQGAVYGLSELADARDHVQRHQGRVFHADPKCAECGESLQAGQSHFQCASCGSFYCNACESRGGMTRSEDTRQLCRACVVAARTKGQKQG